MGQAINMTTPKVLRSLTAVGRYVMGDVDPKTCRKVARELMGFGGLQRTAVGYRVSDVERAMGELKPLEA